MAFIRLMTDHEGKKERGRALGFVYEPTDHTRRTFSHSMTLRSNSRRGMGKTYAIDHALSHAHMGASRKILIDQDVISKKDN